MSANFLPAGTRLTWQGDFGTFAIGNSDAWTVSNAISKVGVELRNLYDLIIERSSDTMGVTGLNAGTITLDLYSGMDRGGQSDGFEDIRGNVIDAFNHINIAVNSARITQYTIPKTSSTAPGVPPTQPGVPQKTGAPTGGGQTDNGNPPVCSFWQRLTGDVEGCAQPESTFWSSLGTVSTGILIGAVVVVGALIYLSVREAV